ncbi:MAG TPA: SGNH/GDSL hydrolase family protein [Pseudonocardiaceae bacterium]|jgi:lysophospholipase L1-like esterase|nr:SGNH/GDSL hydrolase family protein [Pseudonocardiaceae bacterium]
MRLVRILAGAAVVTVATMLGVVVPATAATAANYVALGDSYSSGVGTDDYINDGTSCDRSPEGYPGLWAAAHGTSSFTLAACSGAKTSDVLNNQLGGLNSSTSLVTITIGGNDAGFTTVIENCILSSDSGCQTAVNNAETFARNTLPGLLGNVYSAIRSHAPNASVVVLGYPRFYQIPGSCIFGLSNTKRTAINGGADVLDTVISAEAGKFGGFRFGDVRNAFSAHEICSSGSVWLHSTDFTNITDSYHPFASGYSGGYLPVLDSITG